VVVVVVEEEEEEEEAVTLCGGQYHPEIEKMKGFNVLFLGGGFGG